MALLFHLDRGVSSFVYSLKSPGMPGDLFSIGSGIGLNIRRKTEKEVKSF